MSTDNTLRICDKCGVIMDLDDEKDYIHEDNGYFYCDDCYYTIRKEIELPF